MLDAQGQVRLDASDEHKLTLFGPPLDQQPGRLSDGRGTLSQTIRRNFQNPLQLRPGFIKLAVLKICFGCLQCREFCEYASCLGEHRRVGMRVAKDALCLRSCFCQISRRQCSQSRVAILGSDRPRLLGVLLRYPDAGGQRCACLPEALIREGVRLDLLDHVDRPTKLNLVEQLHGLLQALLQSLTPSGHACGDERIQPRRLFSNVLNH